MTAPFDSLEEYPPLILRWTKTASWCRADGKWELFDTVAGVTLSSHRTRLLAEAARIAEAFRRGIEP